MAKQDRIPPGAKAAALKTRGDVGTAGIGLAVGYFGDLVLTHFFPHLGVPPGAASVYFSSAAVGVKQVVQSTLERSRIARDAAAAEQAAREFSERQSNLILDTLEGCAKSQVSTQVALKLKEAAEKFKSDRKFHAAGILTDEQWNRSIEKAIAILLECGCKAPQD